MKDLIKKFVHDFTQMTEEEADFVESILKWDDEKRDDEKRVAYILAKRMFEDDLEETDKD